VNGTAELTITGLPAERIAELALDKGILLRELTTRTGSLEDAFMQLTADSVEYHGGQSR
jgi:ABC-2 type transport system ATP-binding protein